MRVKDLRKRLTWKERIFKRIPDLKQLEPRSESTDGVTRKRSRNRRAACFVKVAPVLPDLRQTPSLWWLWWLLPLLSVVVSTLEMRERQRELSPPFRSVGYPILLVVCVVVVAVVAEVVMVGRYTGRISRVDEAAIVESIVGGASSLG